MAFKVTAKEIWAIVLALASFLIYVGERVTVNGIVQHDYNYAGIVCGVLAIAVAAYGAVTLKKDIGEQQPMPHYALLGGCALLGLYQALNGASII
jgi:hypothetical protein